jgi:hypothetical protein
MDKPPTSAAPYFDILSRFCFQGQFIQAESYDFGHINDTYIAYFRLPGTRVHRYIFQRINQHVFKKPEEVMANIEAVTTHLRNKIAAAGGNPNRESLTLVPALDGRSYCRTQGGDFWRAYTYIENAQTYHIPQSRVHIYNAGRAFGRFQRYLDDFPTIDLHETIPDFHHTPKRLKTFIDVVEADRRNRAISVKDEIEFVLQRAGEASIIVDLISNGNLPLRVTHNDTKFNNVMIDDHTGEGVCVIDLDTVMPGSALYDFGDAIRSIANTAAEDERDLSKVHFNLDTFKVFTSGYTDAVGDILTAVEFERLVFSAWLMTLECGMRFLTDHIDGDVYFRIHRQNHNLDRSRTQFKLVQDMEINFEEMTKIVTKTYNDPAKQPC